MGSSNRYRKDSTHYRREATWFCPLLYQPDYSPGSCIFMNSADLGVGMFPFRLLQFGSLFAYPFVRVGCKTPRDFDELRKPPQFSFGMFLPQPILVLILCLSYSVMKPLILIAGLVYFCIGYMVYKYQLLFGNRYLH